MTNYKTSDSSSDTGSDTDDSSLAYIMAIVVTLHDKSSPSDASEDSDDASDDQDSLSSRVLSTPAVNANLFGVKINTTDTDKGTDTLQSSTTDKASTTGTDKKAKKEASFMVRTAMVLAYLVFAIFSLLFILFALSFVPV